MSVFSSRTFGVVDKLAFGVFILCKFQCTSAPHVLTSEVELVENGVDDYQELHRVLQFSPGYFSLGS